MNIQPKIEILAEKKLVGTHHKINFLQFNVAPIWQEFRPRLKEINNCASRHLISMSVYEDGYFKNFNPAVYFEKWAAIQVLNFDNTPVGMKEFTLTGGLYAIFHYKGLHTNKKIYEYIFQDWLPRSGYQLDNRPHFEVLGDQYKNNDAESEEDIFIPIKPI